MRKKGLFIKLCHWVPKGSIFSQIRSKSMVSKLQVPFLFGFYLKIRERKKLERKKVRAWPLCHLNNPPTNPFDSLDISMLLDQKEKITIEMKIYLFSVKNETVVLRILISDEVPCEPHHLGDAHLSCHGSHHPVARVGNLASTSSVQLMQLHDGNTENQPQLPLLWLLVLQHKKFSS